MAPLERAEDAFGGWLSVRCLIETTPPLPGGVQPKEQGIRKAVRELGIDRTEAQRAGQGAPR
jgi:hypothetical protein